MAIIFGDLVLSRLGRLGKRREFRLRGNFQRLAIRMLLTDFPYVSKAERGDSAPGDLSLVCGRGT